MARDPLEPADPFQAARHLADSGRPEAAEALLLEFIEAMPEGWQPLTDAPKRRLVSAWDLADYLALAARGDLEGRVMIWQGPSYSRAWCAVARIRRGRGELTGALEAVERSLALEPDHPTALLERAGILDELGRRDEALADWRRVEDSDRATPGQCQRAREMTRRTGSGDGLV